MFIYSKNGTKDDCGGLSSLVSRTSFPITEEPISINLHPLKVEEPIRDPVATDPTSRDPVPWMYPTSTLNLNPQPQPSTSTLNLSPYVSTSLSV
eukprot:scaffold2951_cov81-Cyclotella_meneghiniana.AAC.1